MKTKEWIPKVEQLIANGETENALTILLGAIQADDTERKRQLLLFSSQYHDYFKEQRLGYEVSKNTMVRINEGILNICQELVTDSTYQNVNVKADAFEFTPIISSREQPLSKSQAVNNSSNRGLVLPIAIAGGVLLSVFGIFKMVSGGQPSPSPSVTTNPPSVAPEVEKTAPIITPKVEKTPPITASNEATPSQTTEKRPTLGKGLIPQEEYNKANIAFKEGKYQAALAHLMVPCMMNFANSEEAHHLRGITQVRLNHYEAAIKDFDWVIKSNPDLFPAAYFDKANAILLMGDKSRLPEALKIVNDGFKAKGDHQWGVEVKQKIEAKIKENQ